MAWSRGPKLLLMIVICSCCITVNFPFTASTLGNKTYHPHNNTNSIITLFGASVCHEHNDSPPSQLAPSPRHANNPVSHLLNPLLAALQQPTQQILSPRSPNLLSSRDTLSLPHPSPSHKTPRHAICTALSRLTDPSLVSVCQEILA